MNLGRSFLKKPPSQIHFTLSRFFVNMLNPEKYLKIVAIRIKKNGIIRIVRERDMKSDNIISHM